MLVGAAIGLLYLNYTPAKRQPLPAVSIPWSRLGNNLNSENSTTSVQEAPDSKPASPLESQQRLKNNHKASDSDAVVSTDTFLVPGKITARVVTPSPSIPEHRNDNEATAKSNPCCSVAKGITHWCRHCRTDEKESDSSQALVNDLNVESQTYQPKQSTQLSPTSPPVQKPTRPPPPPGAISTMKIPPIPDFNPKHYPSKQAPTKIESGKGWMLLMTLSET